MWSSIFVYTFLLVLLGQYTHLLQCQDNKSILLWPPKLRYDRSCMHECLIRDRFVPRTGGYPSDRLPHKVLIYSKENFPLFSVESTHHIIVSQRCQRFQRIFKYTFEKYQPFILKCFQDNENPTITYTFQIFEKALF